MNIWRVKLVTWPYNKAISVVVWLCRCIWSTPNVLDSRLVVPKLTWWEMENAMETSKITFTAITTCRIVLLSTRQVLLVLSLNWPTNCLVINLGPCLIKYLVVQGPDFAVLARKISIMEFAIMAPKLIRNVTLIIRIALPMLDKKLKSVNSLSNKGNWTVKVLITILALCVTGKNVKKVKLNFLLIFYTLEIETDFFTEVKTTEKPETTLVVSVTSTTTTTTMTTSSTTTPLAKAPFQTSVSSSTTTVNRIVPWPEVLECPIENSGQLRFINNGICDEFLLHPFCQYDGYDCCTNSTSK